MSNLVDVIGSTTHLPLGDTEACEPAPLVDVEVTLSSQTSSEGSGRGECTISNRWNVEKAQWGLSLDLEWEREEEDDDDDDDDDKEEVDVIVDDI